MTLKATAEEIAADVGIDPITILTFLSAVLPLLIQCFQSPDEAAEWMAQNTKATRRAVRIAGNAAWSDMQDDPTARCPAGLMEHLQRRCARIDGATMRGIYAERRK